ncbi:glycoside hydrolase family 36 protein [Nonomuraea turcica]|uniref:glycoside hydrolase family 36 protein n=1 Tax=Nonomuraea sp. G32 TaxID=3067274 RepID=UPI00273BE97F|nr:glycoside hydrolase family 36 protein [Nonomuraea sp. G32]MDP4509921.1 alpha-galactosidase [Nonomuraea sp. G32]
MTAASGIWQPHDGTPRPPEEMRFQAAGLTFTCTATPFPPPLATAAPEPTSAGGDAGRAPGASGDRGQAAQAGQGSTSPEAAPDSTGIAPDGTEPGGAINAGAGVLGSGEGGGARWVVAETAPGVLEVRVTPERAATVRVAWRVPCVDATAFWAADGGEHRGLPPFWRRPRTAALEKNAPVGCLVGAGDVALCTYAAAEVVRPVRTRTGVVEETGEFGFWVEHEAEPGKGVVLRMDLTRRHFATTLAEVAEWWGSRNGLARDVPRAARMPAYSTWYAMQQHVDAASVERQAAPAAELGCEAIIVDDGWHSDDRGRGYGYVGEWEPSRTSFPDISGHVAKVRGEGLAYLLWYALPFVGRHTALWDRVRPYTLAYKEHMNAAIVDPRYPVIRKLLADHVTRAVREWGMDGLKIDFIDQFAVEDPPPPGPEADCATVNEGVRRLLAQLPGDCLVELRQPYVSPGLWPYATMIRASDCPLSPAHNRQRTVDLRLIAGPLAVHADMLMWHPDENPQRVAGQLINVLFAVPQISVDLTALTPAQEEALRFWLSFFRDHADVLQRGRFEPARPDLAYPQVTARSDDTVITARYAPMPVRVPDTGTLWLANGDASADVLLQVATPGTARATVVDCRGRTEGDELVDLAPGPVEVTVPEGGLLRLERQGQAGRSRSRN